MSPWRKFRSIAALGLLTTALLFPAGLRAAPQAPATGDETAPAVPEWSVQIDQKDSSFHIMHKGVPVLTPSTAFWAENWKWVAGGGAFKIQPLGDQKYSISGGVKDLGLTLTGKIDATASNVLNMELIFQADRARPNVIGGGWQWNLKLDSPAFAKRPADPELLPGNSGWTWPVGEGRAITLRVEGPAPRIYFERDQKNMIRTPFFSDRIEPGTTRYKLTLELPRGAVLLPMDVERYGPETPDKWFQAALEPNTSPVDLSFLNRDDRPAGRRGFVRADGDRLVFADGTTARFWGGNLTAVSLFSTPRQDVPKHAHRMAQLGYNLMRIHHHDSSWVDPNIFGRNSPTTRALNASSLDMLDWWIKCLKDEGIYVWLDMHVGRKIKPGDGVTEGYSEIQGRDKGSAGPFNYYNSQVQALMKDFQRAYLSHRNSYTRLAYKDDPAVVGVLITNENDVTHHGGNLFLPDKHLNYHSALWKKSYTRFAQKHSLRLDDVWKTWLPGPSKIYLAQVEHDFNKAMIDDLRELGVKAPIATTNFWGENPLYSLASLTDGDVIDVHSYGQAESLSKNPHYEEQFLDWIAMGQVYDKPLTITEWNIEYPSVDRFVGPLWMASLASLQGWDAPMLFAYSQNLGQPRNIEKWSTSYDPALTGVMPAAALIYRAGHVSPAKRTYCLKLDESKFFGSLVNPRTSAAIRTLAEQSKLTVAIPETRELRWLKPSRPAKNTIIVTDPNRDFLPPGGSFVQSDTGEITRDWQKGILVIDTPKSQVVSGWIGGQKIRTTDASFETRTRKAVVALSSVDGKPLADSHFILVT
ncbi:MAG: glycoside hydrolase family 5 protein, partial [Isosphaeraceae bacterium]